MPIFRKILLKALILVLINAAPGSAYGVPGPTLLQRRLSPRLKKNAKAVYKFLFLINLLNSCMQPAAAGPTIAITDAADYPIIHGKKAYPIPRYSVNLDLPPEQRWVKIYSEPYLKQGIKDIETYFKEILPAAAIPLAEGVAQDLLRFLPHDYAVELLSIAKTIDAKPGTVVLTNLIYQLMQISGKLKGRNTTGACPMTPKTPRKRRFLKEIEEDSQAPSFCTAILVSGEDEKMIHGRNMDWNMDPRFLKYYLTVDYYKAGVKIFTGTHAAANVGIMHGMQYPTTSTSGFSVSFNARHNGGNVLKTFFEALTSKAMLPAMALRSALETTNDFESAVDFLASKPLVNPCYIQIAGNKGSEGTILARDREQFVNFELKNKSWGEVNVQEEWFKVQCNYDFGQEEPKWDSRRQPGIDTIRSLGRKEGGSVNGMTEVLRRSPTMNKNTDITAVMSVPLEFYEENVWLPEGMELSEHYGKQKQESTAVQPNILSITAHNQPPETTLPEEKKYSTALVPLQLV